MIEEISSNEVTSALRTLFRNDEPQIRRCFAVLDGISHAGKIITDDVENPTWSVVQEPYDGSLYFGGNVNAEIITEVITHLRREADVLVGLWLNDPRQELLPPEPTYDGRVLEFYDRPIGEGLAQYLDSLPDDCVLRRLDRDLVLRTEWGPDDVKAVGGIEVWEKSCFGYCLLQGDEILAEATVGLSALGLYEPGVFTQEAQRGKGYGTIVTARLVREIEALGGQTYWNCAKQNMGSIAIAHKLGYRIEKEYRCLVWEKLPTVAK
jgi:RimJ/RimL family protein N-acetyltransferase